MQTFRKLPTMQPSAKKHSDQKWNGTADQFCGLKIGSTPINIFLQRRTHDSEWRGFACPDFKRLCAISFPPDDKSCRRPRAFASAKIDFHRAAKGLPASIRVTLR